MAAGAGARARPDAQSLFTAFCWAWVVAGVLNIIVAFIQVFLPGVPDGDWIGIRADTSYGPDGIGTTVGTLFDQAGAVGAIQQSVLVRPRRPPSPRNCIPGR